MKKRKLASLLLAGLMLLSAAGCSGDQVKTGAQGGTENAEAEKEATEKKNEKLSYEEKIFDNSYVHTIDVQIADEDWSDLKENPLDKTKYEVNVTIDGEEIEDVSFATKGNTSLSSIASDEDSDRYSFKLNFGKFVEGQTYYGLDKLNLNNIYADATYMKDYISYEIFKAAGAAAPLTSYVFITVNGEDFGLYLAIEEIGESFLERVYAGAGELYKPETAQLNNTGGGMKATGDGGTFARPGGEEPREMGEASEKAAADGAPSEVEVSEKGAADGATPKEKASEKAAADSASSEEKASEKAAVDGAMPDGGMPEDGAVPQMPEDGAMPQMPEDGKFPGGGFGSDDNGASLCYTDDELESYSDIFDNAETNVTDEDKLRVISALKKLSEKEDLESWLDTESIIRYFTAHNFVLNYDSYTGNMLHNYYLYENDGKLSMLPWDYNLAFGSFAGMGGGSQDAASIINYAIDTPLSGASEAERPMWSFIAEDKEYLSLYHTCFDELISGYFESGEFEKEIDRVYEMLLPYVEKDPTAFYDADEFTQGYQTLREFCLLRAESVRSQLEGNLASVTEEQEENSYVNAEGISIKDMGTQNHGMDEHGSGGREQREQGTIQSDQQQETPAATQTEKE